MSIYAVRHGGLIKIGFSSNLPARIGQIIAAIPGKVDFIGHMPGDRDVELHLHARFADSRFQGEWFVANEDIEAFCRIALVATLPERARTIPKALRQDSDSEWARVSADVRSASAIRWPEHSHSERKNSLAEMLGWTHRRVRSLYECQPGCRLKNHEMQRLRETLLSGATALQTDARQIEPDQSTHTLED